MYGIHNKLECFYGKQFQPSLMFADEARSLSPVWWNDKLS